MYFGHDKRALNLVELLDDCVIFHLLEYKKMCLHLGTPSVVYNGHLKFETSVSLINLLYGSRNLAYIACNMGICVRYKPYWVYVNLAQPSSAIILISV